LNPTLTQVAQSVKANIARVIVGKDDVVELLLIALFCEGHVLLEDVPGIGKTTLAKSPARSLGCSFQRIQFTPDLLPSDITGVNVFNQKTGEFEYRPGPIVAQVVLARRVPGADESHAASNRRAGVHYHRRVRGGALWPRLNFCRSCPTSVAGMGANCAAERSSLTLFSVGCTISKVKARKR
jgi:hypothetical protein